MNSIFDYLSLLSGLLALQIGFAAVVIILIDFKNGNKDKD